MGIDADLIRRVVDRSPGADDEFVGGARGLVIGLAVGRFGFDRDSAEEILQATVVKLWEHDHRALRAWRQQGRFTTYLTVIVSRLCLEERSRRQRRREQPHSEPPAAVQEDPDTFDRLAADDRATHLRRALKEMSPRDRLLLTLRHADGRKPAEIASVLDLKPGAARKALHDAGRRLRRRLLELAPELFAGEGNASRRRPSHSSGARPQSKGEQ